MLYVMMQSLIDWLNGCSWLLAVGTSCRPKPSPEPPLSPCLDTADLLSFFFYQSSLPFSLCYEQNFLFRPLSTTLMGVSVISEWPSYMILQIYWSRNMVNRWFLWKFVFSIRFSNDRPIYRKCFNKMQQKCKKIRFLISSPGWLFRRSAQFRGGAHFGEGELFGGRGGRYYSENTVMKSWLVLPIKTNKNGYCAECIVKLPEISQIQRSSGDG